MENTERKTRIAAVGDIHVQHSDQGKWVDYFRKVSEKADVLLICGDLTYAGDAAEARVLAEELKACTIPVVAVLGNHDYEKEQQEEICQVLQGENIHLLDGSCVKVGDLGFAGTKGFGGGFDRYMMPLYGEQMNKQFVRETVDEALRLDQALVRLGNDTRKIVLLHYAPIRDTVVGEPAEIFPFLGSSHLAEPLNRRKVIAAFHGHAHMGTLEGETPAGVKVFNVAKALLTRDGYELPAFLFEV